MCWLAVSGLPTFDMAEGVLDRAMDAYKQLLPVMGGYVVEGGGINSFKLEKLLNKIARMEADLLSQRVKVSLICVLFGKCLTVQECFPLSTRRIVVCELCTWIVNIYLL